jgi:hypothetical protein
MDAMKILSVAEMQTCYRARNERYGLSLWLEKLIMWMKIKITDEEDE